MLGVGDRLSQFVQPYVVGIATWLVFRVVVGRLYVVEWCWLVVAVGNTEISKPECGVESWGTDKSSIRSGTNVRPQFGHCVFGLGSFSVTCSAMGSYMVVGLDALGDAERTENLTRNCKESKSVLVPGS